MYPIYIINCEKDTERWKNMKTELEKQNMKNYQRYPACEFSISNLPSNFLDLPLNQIQKLLIAKKYWNWAALGCWYSHYQLWETLSEPTIIFEDDVVFNPNLSFLEELDKIVSEIGKENYDCIFFYPNKSYVGCPKSTLKFSNKLKSKLFTTFGYLIHPKFIKSILPFKPTCPIDIQLQYLCYKKDKHLYISKTNLIYTDCSNTRSSTIRRNINRKKNKLIKVTFDKKYFASTPSFLLLLNLKSFELQYNEKKILSAIYESDETSQNLELKCSTLEQVEKFMKWAHNGTHSTIL